MIHELLRNTANNHPDKIALIGETRTLTYRELLDESARAAALLNSLGCKPGDRLLLGIPPSPEFHLLFFAAAALGLLIIPVLPSGKISQAVVDAAPRIAAGSAPFLAVVRQYCPALEHELLWKENEGLDLPLHIGPFIRDRIFRDEKMFAVSSSGTTGEPSLYLRSPESLIRRVVVRSQAYGFRSNDVFFTTRPYVSGSAINNHVMAPAHLGCPIVVQPRFERMKAAAAISRHRVTVLYAVPFIFEVLGSIPRSYHFDFSALRLCISGSGAMAPAVAQQFEKRFGKSINLRYSGSHFHPAFTFNVNGPPPCVGRVDGMFPVVILDDGSRALGPAQIGEVAFDIERAPADYRELLQSNPCSRGRYLYTGDLGRMDEAGNLYIVGRKSLFIKVAGNRVEPAEVESVLCSHPAVREAVVFPLNRGQTDETVAAAVITHETLSYENLFRYCKEKLDPYKCPRKIEFVSDLPRSDHGKVVRHLVEATFGARREESR